MQKIKLYKTRFKYAYYHPQESIPKYILQRYLPQLGITQYRAVLRTIPFGRDAVLANTIIEDVERLKDLFMHSILQSQQCNWLFIIEVNVLYCEAKEIDEDSSKLIISKRNICRWEIDWCGIRFWYRKFKVTVIGGYCNNGNNSFLKKEARQHIDRDTHFILFSPVVTAETKHHPKPFITKNSSNKWMFRSKLFF